MNLPGRSEQYLKSAILFLAAWLLFMPPSADARKWMNPAPFNSMVKDSFKFESPSVAMGNRGYTVLAWAQYPKHLTGHTSKSRLRSRVMIRVRRPGAGTFGPVLALGSAGASSPEVKIGANGFTVLVWQSKSSQTMVTTRWPNTGWSEAQALDGPKTQSTGDLSVGPDGTVVLATEGRWLPDETRPPLYASVRSPGGSFSPLGRIDRDGRERGHYYVSLAARNGKATIVFESACPVGTPSSEIDPMQYVDVTRSAEGFEATESEGIPNSKCPTFYPSISGDADGRQYLLINGSAPSRLLDIKVAKREVGKSFEAAESLARPKEFPTRSFLTVTPNGRVALIWRSAFRGKSARWVRSSSQRMGPFSTPKLVSTKHYFSLGDAKAYPDGTLATIWRTRDYRFGIGLIPRNRAARHVAFPWPRHKIRNVPMQHVETAPDGRALAWWEIQNDSGEGVDLRWVNLPHRAPPQQRDPERSGLRGLSE